MEASAAQYDELKASVDALGVSLNDAKGRVDAHSAELAQKIADLEAQLAAGQPVDLSPLKAEVESLKATADSIEAPAAPAPADPGAPPAGDAPPPAEGGAPPAADPPPADPPDAPPPDPAPA